MLRVLACLLALLLIPQPAAAYVDPTAGGFLLQLLLGGITGLALMARVFVCRLLGRLRSRRNAR